MQRRAARVLRGAAIGTWLWAFALGVFLKLVANTLPGVPVLSLLALTSVAFTGLGILFGWRGVVAMAAVQLAQAVARQTGPPLEIAAALLAYSLAGLLAWQVFARVPRLDRGLRDVRSVAWFAAAGGLGALATSGLLTAIYADDFWPEVAVWSRSTIVSVWVFTPALLVLGRRWLARWLAPLPSLLATREIVPAEDPTHLGRAAFPAVLWTLATALLEVQVARGQPVTASWLDLLYLFPIYWLAERARLPGGLLGAAIAGLGLLVERAVEARGVAAPPHEVALYAQLLLFWAAGVFLGAARVREGALREELAASNARLRRDLRRVVRALSGAVAAKDLYTEGHLRRVNRYALLVGSRLGLDGRDFEQLEIAGALHDIGKIGVPEQVLGKRGPLDAEERALVERHPEIGARILENVDGFAEAAALVRFHQARWDGGPGGEFPGYPQGVAGERIPLGARIIAVVDAFDAMTTDRPYRPAMPVGEARRVLRAERGRQFDPEVVDAFLRAIEDEPWETSP